MNKVRIGAWFKCTTRWEKKVIAGTYTHYKSVGTRQQSSSVCSTVCRELQIIKVQLFDLNLAANPE
jgi:hypothetical protein